MGELRDCHWGEAEEVGVRGTSSSPAALVSLLNGFISSSSPVTGSAGPWDAGHVGRGVADYVGELPSGSSQCTTGDVQLVPEPSQGYLCCVSRHIQGYICCAHQTEVGTVSELHASG